MNKVLFWGIGSFYNEIVNSVLFEEMKKNLEVVAFVSNDLPFNTLYNKPVISPVQINSFNYDYIVVTSLRFEKEIFREATKLYNIPIDKLIKGRVFNLPRFDFKKYIEVKEKKVCIIADSCLGGLIYNTLGLEFNTPFINMQIFSEDYFKLVKNFKYYISQPLNMVSDNCVLENENVSKSTNFWGISGEPIAGLDDIWLHCIHTESFDAQKRMWKKRVEKINNENLLFLMVIENDEIAKKFDSLPVKNKIGFYFKDTKYSSIVNVSEWNNPNIRFKMNYNFRRYIHNLFMNDSEILKTIDILRLINGEKDFMLVK